MPRYLYLAASSPGITFGNRACELLGQYNSGTDVCRKERLRKDAAPVRAFQAQSGTERWTSMEMAKQEDKKVKKRKREREREKEREKRRQEI